MTETGDVTETGETSTEERIGELRLKPEVDEGTSEPSTENSGAQNTTQETLQQTTPGGVDEGTPEPSKEPLQKTTPGGVDESTPEPSVESSGAQNTTEGTLQQTTAGGSDEGDLKGEVEVTKSTNTSESTNTTQENKGDTFGENQAATLKATGNKDNATNAETADKGSAESGEIASLDSVDTQANLNIDTRALENDAGTGSQSGDRLDSGKTGSSSTADPSSPSPQKNTSDSSGGSSVDRVTELTTTKTYRAVTLPEGVWLPELPEDGDDKDGHSIHLESGSVKIDDSPQTSASTDSNPLTTTYKLSSATESTTTQPDYPEYNEHLTTTEPESLGSKKDDGRKSAFRGRRHRAILLEEIESEEFPDGFYHSSTGQQSDDPSFRKIRSVVYSGGAVPGTAGTTTTTTTTTTTHPPWSSWSYAVRYSVDSSSYSQNYGKSGRLSKTTTTTETSMTSAAATRGPMRKIVFNSLNYNVHTAPNTTKATTTTSTTAPMTTIVQKSQNIHQSHSYGKKRRQAKNADLLKDHADRCSKKNVSAEFRLRLGLQVQLEKLSQEDGPHGT